MNRRFSDDVLFMNWCYEEDPPMNLPLDAADEPNRYPIQLYHRTATQSGELTGKQVLEVGCGRGGGASYLMRALGPASYVGLDLNAAGIDFCSRRHRLPGLRFVQGNAENLPFPAESFDAVINVESAALYPHFDRFLSEVGRVLRPGGTFLYADTRWRFDLTRWESALAGAQGLRIVSWREINAEVMRGMELHSPAISAATQSVVPRFLRRWARKQDSLVLRNLESGRLLYRMYCFARTI
ncbi:SAM-dependent methyltransferase [Mycobacterium fragae]|uniref:SAM-dependent methyltransferase n=2 Tax=Mycobacterium fragae TaxID=1260918 RepID=A0A1X1UFG3_9MYCO|nr:class I SAM-dependent methyltransferase [Mycobacterium fragae]ORV55563.1 SAM-dependent methyltransferase [Mycobacterium fragae]